MGTVTKDEVRGLSCRLSNTPWAKRPSKFTEHSVKHSPWKSGKGDVLKDLSQSCKKYNLDFGIYISPWDRHNPLYGTGEKYNEYFEYLQTESPLAFGLHPNAEIGFRTVLSDILFSRLLELQPRDAGVGNLDAPLLLSFIAGDPDGGDPAYGVGDHVPDTLGLCIHAAQQRVAQHGVQRPGVALCLALLGEGQRLVLVLGERAVGVPAGGGVRLAASLWHGRERRRWRQGRPSRSQARHVQRRPRADLREHVGRHHLPARARPDLPQAL